MSSHMRREIEEIPEATARLLDRAGPVLKAAGREIASPAEARTLMGLAP